MHSSPDSFQVGSPPSEQCALDVAATEQKVNIANEGRKEGEGQNGEGRDLSCLQSFRVGIRRHGKRTDRAREERAGGVRRLTDCLPD